MARFQPRFAGMKGHLAAYRFRLCETVSMPPSRDIKALLDIMAQLRTPGSGCPWDLEQDFASIAPYTIEEAYEVCDAIACCRSCFTPAWPRKRARSLSATWSRPSPKR